MKRALSLIALLAATLPVAAQQTAEAVFDAMVEAHESSMAGIDTYVVVGDAFATHHRRTASGDWESATESAVAGMALGNMTTRFSTDDPNELRERFVGHATLRGREVFGASEALAIEIDPSAYPSGESDVTSMTLFIDPERMVVAGFHAIPDGESGSITVYLEDFRDVDGLVYPFRTRVVIEQAGAGPDQEQVDRAREALAQMQERLAAMPQAQRESMEAMMGEQLDRMEQMASGGGLETIYEVREIRVNQGVDASLFD